MQRYAAEWAAALRQMERLEPITVIPGHGPVIFGKDRAAQVLRDGAAVLEHLVRETLALMNRGATLDQVLHAVTAPADREAGLATYAAALVSATGTPLWAAAPWAPPARFGAAAVTGAAAAMELANGAALRGVPSTALRSSHWRPSLPLSSWPVRNTAALA